MSGLGFVNVGGVGVFVFDDDGGADCDGDGLRGATGAVDCFGAERVDDSVDPLCVPDSSGEVGPDAVERCVFVEPVPGRAGWSLGAGPLQDGAVEVTAGEPLCCLSGSEV